MEDNIDKIELRSNELNDILGKPPSWIVRWGIMVFLIIVCVFLIGSYFFRYPDIVSSPVLITTENPPAKVIAKSSGRLKSLIPKENDYIKRGELIGVIENTGDLSAINRLSFFLTTSDSTAWSSKLPVFDNLGPIQPYYGIFATKKMELANFFLLQAYQNRKVYLEEELKNYQGYLSQLEKQSQLTLSSMVLTKKQLERDSILHATEVISDSKLEESIKNLFSQKMTYEQSLTSISQAKMQIAKIKKQLFELSLAFEEKGRLLKIEYYESLKNLKAQVALWENTYLLKASQEGRVSYTKVWSENHFVNIGDLVCTVIPEETGDTIAKIELAMQKAGKVEIGQRVNLKLESYPYMEFGLINGEIQSISLVPTNNVYSVVVKLPNGLKSFYGKKLKFTQEMTGRAEIITDNLRLLHRVINPIKMLLKKNIKVEDQ